MDAGEIEKRDVELAGQFVRLSELLRGSVIAGGELEAVGRYEDQIER